MVEVEYTKPPYKRLIVTERIAGILEKVGAARVVESAPAEQAKPARKRTYKRRDMQAEE